MASFVINTSCSNSLRLSNGEVLLLFLFLEWIIQFVFKRVLITLSAWGFQCSALQNISFSFHLRKPKDLCLCTCVTFFGFYGQRRPNKDFSHVWYHISELRCGFHTVIIYHSITLHPVMRTTGPVCFSLRELQNACVGVYTVHPLLLFSQHCSQKVAGHFLLSWKPLLVIRASVCWHIDRPRKCSRWKPNVYLCHIP